MAMPQVDWESIKSFVQIPLSWFKEVSRRSNLFSKHPLIVIDRNNPDGVGIGIDATQLPKGGGGGSNAAMMFNYDESTNLVGAGVVCLGRYYKSVAGLDTPVTDGSVRLCINYADSAVTINSSVVVEIGDGFAYFGDGGQYIPLYDIEGGKVVKDYRNIPVHVMRS